jgi:CBS domain-containing protein
MKISDILEHKAAHSGSDTVTIPSDATIRELVASLVENRIGAAVVADGDDHLVGIVSERDIVRALDQRGTDTLDAQVRDLMTVDVSTCTPDDDVDRIAETMTERRIRHMPVVVDGALHGLVSIGDVVKSRIGELEQERGHLEHYISG